MEKAAGETGTVICWELENSWTVVAVVAPVGAA